MALYARLASHVFDTFAAFRDWMVVQQFDIATKPERAPILKAGQRVAIRDIKCIYIVTQPILDVSSILEPDTKGGYLDQLIQGQAYLFATYAPAGPRVQLNAALTEDTLALNEILITQNASITLAFDNQGENFNKSSNLYITHTGNVTLNTGKFIVDVWSGEGNTRYRAGKTLELSKNSSYLIILKQADLVYMIEMGKTSFDLSQNIPDSPDDASPDKIPSEQAVSKGLLKLNETLQQAIDNSSGFLSYSGINPATDTIIKITDETQASDIAYTARTVDELAAPTEGNMYALVLRDTSSVNVYKSKTVIEPIYHANSKYLGEGNFGTQVDEVNTAITASYPRAVKGDIVSNLDTNTEWEFNSLEWVETIRPAKESLYAYNSSYLGIYAVKKDPTLQALAIDMCFPKGKDNDIVNNTLTNTEWTKGTSGWKDTGNPFGSTAMMSNPKVSGFFTWSATDIIAVEAALRFQYGETLDDGSIVSVKGGNEWVCIREVSESGEESVRWMDTGNSAGTSAEIDNPRYFGTGNFGTGIEASNNLILAYPDAQTGDAIGNNDTETDWLFDVTWKDSESPIGTYSKITNPLYVGEYDFSNDDRYEMSAILAAKFTDAPIGNIVYNNEYNSEWEKLEAGNWEDTYNELYTTPQMVQSDKILGTFSYPQSWTPPATIIAQAFPDAIPGNFVNNNSTGTEWELSKEKLYWVDTKRPVGTTIIEDNPNYLGEGNYKTNPPTDNYILLLVYPKATEGQFVTNLATNTQWEFARSKWGDTKAELLNKWLMDREGVYEWEFRTTSGISNGALFHITTRYPETDKTGVYWFANTWNILDFESIEIAGFTNEEAGIIMGKRLFGYVMSVPDADGNPTGKVYGLENTGTGKRFLNDKGEYASGVTKEELTTNTHIYLNFETGNDDNTGLSEAQAWKTNSRLALYLASQSQTYVFTPNKPDYPARITVHIAGNGEFQDLVIENIAYLTIVGSGEASTAKAHCKRLHIVNSSVTLGNALSIKERIVAWKSKVRTTDTVSCGGIYLVDSQFEQATSSVLNLQDPAEPSISAIYIDEDSSFYHASTINTEVNLNNTVPFLNILGTYTKGNAGSFYSSSIRRGQKYVVGPRAIVIGTSSTWMEEGNNIPYVNIVSQNISTPITVPVIRTLYGTEDKTGFEIADGTDLAELMSKGGGGFLVKETIADALRDIPQQDRYLGMMIYITQLRGYYYFKKGVTDTDLVPYIVPHYNITKVISPCCAASNWQETFPWNHVDEEGNLTDKDLYVTEPVQSVILNEALDWNTLIYPGDFYIQSIAGVSVGAPDKPNLVTAWWWLTVENHWYEGNVLKVVQIARRQDLSAYVLSRTYDNEIWSNWSYNYGQYSG